MKKLLFLTIAITFLKVHSFNIPELNPEKLAAMKQGTTAMRDSLQAEICKDTTIAMAASMGSKTALIGSIILLTKNQYKQAVASACAYGVLETVWYMYMSKASINRSNAQALELIASALPSQNALPNDKNQQ